jgi:uncharacterized protein (TIGR04255 family)
LGHKYLLSIDGGGIRGILPATALLKLEETTQRPLRETFSFVAGTSTGALLSAAIAAGIPAGGRDRLRPRAGRRPATCRLQRGSILGGEAEGSGTAPCEPIRQKRTGIPLIKHSGVQLSKPKELNQTLTLRNGCGPHFRRPPVVEVVCGVQFQDLEGWATPHYGKLWSRLEGEYPDFEERPPLPRLRLEPPVSDETVISPLPPLRRVFFIQRPGNYLIQVQQNRFLHNWRRISDSDEYPRYDRAYERFVRYWGEFKAFVVQVGLPEPQPEVFELTYINHIMAEGATFPRDVWTYLDFYQQSPEATAKAASELMMHFGWPLPSDLGILTLDVKHGHRVADQREILLMELNARGKARQGEAGMQDWFDVAHHAIVTTFDGLTTEEAHESWGKYS